MFAPLVRWALAATPADVPAYTLERARLQHIAGLGVLRTARATQAGRDCLAGPLNIGGSAALLYSNHDDYLLAGRTGIGALPAAWLARERSLADTLVDTVAANEIGGRVGLAFANVHNPQAVDTRVPAIAAAVVYARARGLSTAEATRLLESAACGEPCPLHHVAFANAAREVAVRIHTPGGEPSPATPGYPGALGGLGSVWFTNSLTLKRWPGTPWGNVALDALHTILERHIKAAEKRLRPDQLDRIEFFGPSQLVQTERAAAEIHDPSAFAWSLSKSASLLVGLHELSSAQLDPGSAGDKQRDIAALEPRITVAHDWKLTTQQAVHMASRLAPVLGEHGAGSYFEAGRRFTPGLPQPAQWWGILQQQPWNILRSLREPANIESLALDAACAVAFPIHVKLYTTRGGWWPERRSTPSGWGPGMAAVAQAKHGDPAAVSAAMAASGDTPLGSWLDSLLA